MPTRGATPHRRLAIMAKLQSARTYVVSNPSALFGAGRVITFRHTAPVGSVVDLTLHGRPVRALLTDTVWNGYRCAELLFTTL
ncbi:hypothetical protein ACFC07_22370 [Streptomyces sp. NPDC056099]|uniref:hypothetical protein n=1 Tax=unclassified Streptomyces TaxID=2593676 RepID=UPI0035E207A9